MHVIPISLFPSFNSKCMIQLPSIYTSTHAVCAAREPKTSLLKEMALPTCPYHQSNLCSASCFYLHPATTYCHNAKPQLDKSQSNGPLPPFLSPNSNKKQWAGADPLLNNSVEVFTTTGTKSLSQKIQCSNSFIFSFPPSRGFWGFQKGEPPHRCWLRY